MTAIDPFIERNQAARRGLAIDGVELAMLRHDLRGALQAVIGGLGQLDSAPVAAELRERVGQASASASALGRMLGPILGDPLDPDGAVVDVDGFLDDLRRRHCSEARARGLVLRVEAEQGAPDLLALDRGLLERVVDNLVRNAIRFTPSGGVRLTLGGDEAGIALAIADDGPGVPADELAALLEPGPAAADPCGPGLGLRIARALTERLGGALGLRNRLAGGFEAVLRFPASVAITNPAGPAALPDLAGLRVLLAEDNPTNQMVATQMLRSLNAEVRVCADGVEALECFEREPADLVVVDIEMPRLSGLDVIRAIRARTDAKALVPIVALTAYAMREHRERIAAAGANGLISKPITSVEALGRGLAAHVARRADAVAAAHPLAEADGPVIDTGIYEALCEAIGRETMGELLDKVVADLLGAQRDLAAALDPLDRATVRSASHILISVAGALGAVRLQSCARSLNGAAPADTEEAVAAGVRRCVAEIDEAVAFARSRRRPD
jgi:two-component system, OmpR family, aerobic respiration control sensor histidine kinase ArcB